MSWELIFLTCKLFISLYMFVYISVIIHGLNGDWFMRGYEAYMHTIYVYAYWYDGSDNSVKTSRNWFWYKNRAKSDFLIVRFVVVVVLLGLVFYYMCYMDMLCVLFR